MEECYDAVIASPVGALGLLAKNDQLSAIEFLGDGVVLRPPQTALLQEVQRQLDAWFDNPAFHFDLPYCLEGTLFRRKVWEQIARIPCGQVLTYADIARELHTSPRPVGGACGANPLPLVIPCHRVVATHGLGGFNARRGGVDWLPIKRWLLAHEQSC